MKIVFVYLNQKIPKYAVLNLLNFKKRFPMRNLVYISDLETNIATISSLGITCELVESPISKWNELSNYESLNPKFRNGFWLNTLARFYAISEFSKKYPDESILQIECDVLLMDDFPFDQISKITKQIAFPVINDTEAIPSVLYLKNFIAAYNLLQYINFEFKRTPHLNDMLLLRKYSNDWPKRTEILPTNFSYESGFNSWVSLKLKNEMVSGVQTFKGVFDGATWGQYISGEDPRNTLGIRRVFHVLKHHAVNPSKFIWEKNLTSDLIRIKLSSEEESYPLFCLHIHSKDLKFFGKRFGLRVQERINSLPRQEKRELMPLITLFNFKFTTALNIIKILLKKL